VEFVRRRRDILMCEKDIKKSILEKPITWIEVYAILFFKIIHYGQGELHVNASIIKAIPSI